MRKFLYIPKATSTPASCGYYISNVSLCVCPFPSVGANLAGTWVLLQNHPVHITCHHQPAVWDHHQPTGSALLHPWPVTPVDSSGVMPRVSQGSRWPRNQLSAFLCHGASKWDCWGCQCLPAMRCCSGSSRIRTWSQLSYGSTTWNGKQIELNDDRQLKKTNSSTEENDATFKKPQA